MPAGIFVVQIADQQLRRSTSGRTRVDMGEVLAKIFTFRTFRTLFTAQFADARQSGGTQKRSWTCYLRETEAGTIMER
jgi:hypothetical protein